MSTVYLFVTIHTTFSNSYLWFIFKSPFICATLGLLRHDVSHSFDILTMNRENCYNFKWCSVTQLSRSCLIPLKKNTIYSFTPTKLNFRIVLETKLCHGYFGLRHSSYIIFVFTSYNLYDISKQPPLWT